MNNRVGAFVMGLGTACGAVLGYSRWAVMHMEVDRDEQCRALHLVTPDEAQLMPVVRIRNFLSCQQADQLKESLEAVLQQCGSVERNTHGVASAVDAVWSTYYLHTDHLFQRAFPELLGRMRGVMEAADSASWGVIERSGAAAADIHFRNIELHRYGPGGALRDAEHYDAGSLITLDVMLEDAFTGGRLVAGQSPPFEKGDALIFVSHKRHHVTPVTSGQRVVLVAELWVGPQKHCAHRCLTTGPCNYSLNRADLDKIGRNVAMLG